MAQRPNLLDLRANSHSSAMSSSSRPLRSPRIHIAGEAPPELSPLDAFAMQSRLLAKQLQESTKDGNRVSRLPPLTLESPLIVQGRSDYFRSMSVESPSESGDSPSALVDSVAHNPEVEDAFEGAKRPKSMHPRMSRIAPAPDAYIPALPDSIPEVPRGRQPTHANSDPNLFGARQEERSPSPLHSDTQSQHDKQSEKSPVRRDNASATESKQRSFDEMGLVPPRPFYPKRSSSALSSSPPIFPDEDSASHSGITSHPTTGLNRKLSSGSAAFSISGVPAGSGSFHRSPSVGSDSSALPRPSFNFSRPLSRAGTPNFDMPSRQASSDSQPSFVLADDSAHTPVSMHSEAFLDQQAEDGKNTGGSYIYSKFSLPRGKALQRGEEAPPQATRPNNSQWDQPPFTSNNVHRFPENAPPSPPSRPSSSSARVMSDDSAHSLPRPSTDAGKASLDISRLQALGYQSPNPGRPSVDAGRQSEDTVRGRTLQAQNDRGRGRTPASTTTSDSASTIRPPPTARSGAPTASEMSAEEHLAKGIECHENGSVNESTYHLRLAARQNNPTAMLLYALACRHGWGMRPNQREGVQWLRKAAEYASVELADDEGQAKEGKRVDFLENKTRKAQFALSIYELGVSHMNGWGIEQDKSLALRCFEIAGNWGDVDALAEAGFCYAQGVGCKKNLKKSAKFYRMAEAKGMSMVGNSWIHKSKYNEDTKSKDKKKARSKSRTRAMFGLKSSS